MERSDAVEIGVAIGSVAIFVAALAVVGTLYGASGSTFDGTMTGDAVLDEGGVTGTIDGDLSGDVNATSGGQFSGTFEGTFNGTNGESVNGTLSVTVTGTLAGSGGDTLSEAENATLTGTFSGTLDDENVSGQIKDSTVTGTVQENDHLSGDGALALVGALLLFILVLTAVGFFLARQDS
ncbi:DUF7472 family protein [Halapricum desulfuricans]|uniref:Uncharacterized protein n=1 Tax=Halapricum desulfuricans TaxID=2841257 RepID=A0A897NSM0_9EURY|nr:hypothetical protein [Halapricum desulfuricans]QSG13813.1 hypothetical protein HSEST_0262 [Halapricum desulfuricans]